MTFTIPGRRGNWDVSTGVVNWMGDVDPSPFNSTDARASQQVVEIDDDTDGYWTFASGSTAAQHGVAHFDVLPSDVGGASPPVVPGTIVAAHYEITYRCSGDVTMLLFGDVDDTDLGTAPEYTFPDTAGAWATTSVEAGQFYVGGVDELMAEVNAWLQETDPTEIGWMTPLYGADSYWYSEARLYIGQNSGSGPHAQLDVGYVALVLDPPFVLTGAATVKPTRVRWWGRS